MRFSKRKLSAKSAVIRSLEINFKDYKRAASQQSSAICGPIGTSSERTYEDV